MAGPAASARHTGWHFDAQNARLNVFYRGTRMAHFTATAFNLAAGASAGMTITAGGLTVTAGGLTVNGGNSNFANDLIVSYGTGGDIATVERSTALLANTALTSVVIGTPVTAATPADSMLYSNLTASGDFAWMLNDGAGNSWEWERMDASASLHVFNEAANDIDHRWESVGNANLLVMDAGTNSIAFGRATSANTAVFFDTTNRAAASATGLISYFGGTSRTDTAAAGTIAVFTLNTMDTTTIAGTNARTYTDTANLYIAGLVAAGANVTITAARNYALFIDVGQLRVDNNLQVANTATFGTTQPDAAAVFQSGTAPVGAVTTAGAIFASATVMRKIIADGTASNIET